MNEITEAFRVLLGTSSEDLTVWQMSARAAVIYVIAVAIIRMGKKRFMSRATPFDLIIAIVFGSIISRVITGDADFLAGLGAVVTLMILHWLFAAISVRWSGFSRLVKGHSRILVKDGQMDAAEMRRAQISEGDLREGLRQEGVSDLAEVREARLERSGEVSVLRKS